jgi:PIN domain nuclease of toxin-antitoxin system
MRLLLDTHIFLWHITDDERLSPDVQAAISDPDNEVYLSVASTWEAEIKFALGKLPVPESPSPFFPKQRTLHRIAKLSVEEEDVEFLSLLPMLHRDPFDRMLVAQANRHGMKLVTDDGLIKQYPVQLFPSK